MTGGREDVTRASVDERRLFRNIQSLIDSPIRNRCVVCGHVKHNDLGYCQNSGCSCENGTTIEGVGIILRRDLADVLSSLSDERLAGSHRLRAVPDAAPRTDGRDWAVQDTPDQANT